jgi:mono/diheme cytochrome c family protein
MKKLTIIIIAIVALYSCAKKMTPVATQTTATANEAKPAKLPAVQANINNETAVADSIEKAKVAAKVATTKTETAEVTIGKETFKAKCGRCHELKNPADYTAVKWVKLVDWMAPKAKLSAAEKDNVLAYVSFYAKS